MNSGDFGVKQRLPTKLVLWSPIPRVDATTLAMFLAAFTSLVSGLTRAGFRPERSVHHAFFVATNEVAWVV